MKPIVLTDKAKEVMIKHFMEKFNKALDEYAFNIDKKKFSFEAEINQVAKEKVHIIYNPTAYLRMLKLVNHYESEVTWYGLIKKLEDKKYYVYDVIVCPQYVSGAKVDTDDDETLEFFSNLSDEQAENMYYQAHSHVNFSTEASGVDMQNQIDILGNMLNKDGFFLFQIWNKKGEVSTYLYDLGANIFYDSKDVEMEIEDPDYESLDAFIEANKSLVKKREVKPVANIGRNDGWYGDWPRSAAGYGSGYGSGYYGGYNRSDDGYYVNGYNYQNGRFFDEE